LLSKSPNSCPPPSVDESIGIHLEEYALGDQKPQRLGIPVEVGASLWMTESDSHPTRSEVEEEPVEAVDSGRWAFDQDIGAALAVRGEPEVLLAGIDGPYERDLGTGDHSQRNPLSFQSTLNSLGSRGQLVYVDVREVRPQMWSRGHRGDSRLYRRPGHSDRTIQIGGAVIDPGQDVGVDVDEAVQEENSSRFGGIRLH
jgi:hypothetical protein